jgi:hypothetical protein
VRLVALDSEQPTVVLVRVSEFYINYFVQGTLYKGDLLESTKSNKLQGSYRKFHLAHPIFIRPVALRRRNIRALQKIKFHTQKGRNFGDTIKGRLSSRTTSKSRFKVILGQHATKKGNFYTK